MPLRSRAVLINLVFVTAASLGLRAIGVVFNIYLTGRIGSDGIGLFQLTASVYGMATTLATSGLRFAVTRLAAEETGRGNQWGARIAVRRCLALALACSLLTAAAMWRGAAWIARVWIGDARTGLSLRIMALSLPFLAASSVFCGYFAAQQRMVPVSILQIVEQFIRIAAIIALLSSPLLPPGLEYACAAVVAGGCAGEALSCLMIALLYLAGARKIARGGPVRRMTLRMLRIATPLAVSSYVRTALSTAEHLLIPRGLRASGASGEAALSTYGIIHGMVFPLLLFPAALVMALAQLVIPELTESQVSGRRVRADYIVNRVFRIGLFFSMEITAVLMAFGRELGMVFCKNTEAAYFLPIFAPLALIMYMDSLTDGLLKGLGEQMASMRYNIIDAFCGLTMVLLVVPRKGVAGYIFAVFFTEILNFVLSLGRLLSVSRLSVGVSLLLRVTLSAVCSVVGAAVLLPQGAVLARAALALLFYPVVLYLSSCVSREDVAWLGSVLRGTPRA